MKPKLIVIQFNEKMRSAYNYFNCINKLPNGSYIVLVEPEWNANNTNLLSTTEKTLNKYHEIFNNYEYTMVNFDDLKDFDFFRYMFKQDIKV